MIPEPSFPLVFYTLEVKVQLGKVYLAITKLLLNKFLWKMSDKKLLGPLHQLSGSLSGDFTRNFSANNCTIHYTILLPHIVFIFLSLLAISLANSFTFSPLQGDVLSPTYLTADLKLGKQTQDKQ